MRAGILAITFIGLGLLLLAFIPSRLFVPGGWPIGSRWYHMNLIAFWAFLLAGTFVGLFALKQFSKRL